MISASVTKLITQTFTVQHNYEYQQQPLCHIASYCYVIISALDKPSKVPIVLNGHHNSHRYTHYSMTHLHFKIFMWCIYAIQSALYCLPAI